LPLIDFIESKNNIVLFFTCLVIMSHILVSGSVAYDTIIHVAEAFEDNILPEKVASLSTGFYSHHTIKSSGGTAHNISYNLGLL